MKYDIFVNGNVEKIEESIEISLHEFLKKYRENFQSRNIVVALNEVFVPKEHYVNTILKSNDHLDILEPFPGG